MITPSSRRSAPALVALVLTIVSVVPATGLASDRGAIPATAAKKSTSTTKQKASAKVARAKRADNATRVGGLRASRTPKAGQLLALDRNRKLPASVLPVLPAGPQGPQGARGEVGPQGPKGDTGTVDTSDFFTRAQADERFVPRLSGGGLLAAGALGVGEIPATGCGVRMMWHPAKAAFRAGSPGACGGSVTGWNDENVGEYSWAGGFESQASGAGSLAFGLQTRASGSAAVSLGSQNRASGNGAVSAGISNTSSGFASQALGYFNESAGQGSAAIGYRNQALSDYSVALGQRAQVPAGMNGSFVFADASTTSSTLSASAANQFLVRAAGGIRLRTSATVATGCDLPAGSGVFSCTSDRNAKRGFAPVDGADVLRRLATVPVTTWSYKSEPTVRHMGPTAQDFRRAFGLGTDDRTIGHIDQAGVTLAAVKELHATAQRQQRQLDEQTKLIAELERRLERVEGR